MYSKFPFSMENIPRQGSFCCLSLKFGSIFSALLDILYTLLALSQCLATLLARVSDVSPEHFEGVLGFALLVTITAVHGVTFSLSAVMLLGVLRDKVKLMKPWVIWKSIQLIAYILLFVMWSTVYAIFAFDDNTLIFYAFQFLIIMIQFYMLMLVASYYKTLEEEREETKRLRTLDCETWYTDA